VPDAPPRGPRGPPPDWKFGASTYAGIGLAGLAVLAVGLWAPILAGVPGAAYARIGFAAVGGFTAVLGLGRWNVLRRYPDGGRPRPRGVAEQLPSFRSYPPPPRQQSASSGRGGARPTALRLRGAAVVAALVVAAVVLTALPTPLGPAGSTAPGPGRSASPVAASNPIPVCTIVYPQYGPVDGLYPPLPLFSQQMPCHISHDEVHATFSANGGGSGENVRFPIELPGSGDTASPWGNFSPAQEYSDAYLGMVVKGDPSSFNGQSYAELVFTPSTAGTSTVWNISVAVWSLILDTSCPDGLNFSWEDQFGCVVDDAAPGAPAPLATGLAGGTWANVTFDGSVTAGGADLAITFNDSTDPTDSLAWTANAASTGTYGFQPLYGVACPDACLLNWSEPFGLGAGFDLCYAVGCFSYNASAQQLAPPFVVGSPEYWNGLAYAADYRYVSFESSTGACGGVSSVADCALQALAGEYPAFTFNGTEINFAGNYSWTTESFGGAAHEFDAYASPTDFVPMFLTNLTNSSDAGYVAPATGLNVSVDAQALGTIHNVTLAYELPSGVFGNDTMHLAAGATSDGTYNGTVPAVGGNGVVAFRAVAIDRAGATVESPLAGAPSETVLRGPIPTVSVLISETPPQCGGVSINGGGIRANGTTAALSAGTYPVRSYGCYPYQFSGWSTTGGITVVGGPGVATSVEFHSNGTLHALWRYVVPLDTVTVQITPSSCGTVTINDSGSLAPSSEIQLRDAGSYSLSASGCGGESFSGWTVSSPTNLSILGPTVTLHGNGTLTATFLPTSGSVAVSFTTDPASCGGIAVDNVGYVTGESLHLDPGSSYPIAAVPCAGWGFAGNVLAENGVAVSAGTLHVTGAGSVEFFFYRLTIVTISTDPASCGGVDWDGVFEASGAALNVTNHTVHSLVAEPCTGYYVQGLAITGNLTLAGTVVTVNGPGSVEVVFRPGTPQYFIAVLTDPAGCGTVELDGVPFTDAEYLDVAPGSIDTVGAIPCTGYGFVGWQVSGGVTVAGSLAYVNQSGSIEAIFHALVAVTVETDPSTCGGIGIGGIEYSDGAIALVPDDYSLSIVAVPCPHEVLQYWQTSGGAEIANGSLALTATAIVDAVFQPATYDVNVTVAPATCGSVSVDGVSYSNGTTLVLNAGIYPVATTGCPGFELLRFTSTGGVNVSGTELAVQGAGNLTAWQGPVPPQLTLAVPSTAGTGGATYFSVAVAVPIPPYNYSYRWSFGDGSTASTADNVTSHTYAAAGTYEVSVTVTDPFGRTATSEGNVTVEVGPGAPSYGIGATGEIVVAGAAIAVVAGAVVAFLRARRPPSSTEDAARGGPAPSEARP
jgi:PKD domain